MGDPKNVEVPEPAESGVRLLPNKSTISARDLIQWWKSGEREEYPEDVERPKTRGDCAGGERPCPWVSCRYNTHLEVDSKGVITVRENAASSCVLDVADEGEHTLEEVGEALGLVREAVRLIERSASKKAYLKMAKFNRY